MQRSLFILALMAGVAAAHLAVAAEQGVNLEAATLPKGQEAGVSLLAAATNVVYFPMRLAVTTITAPVGGLVGWLNGGDLRSAQAVWNSTDGPAYMTASMLQGHEPRSGALASQ